MRTLSKLAFVVAVAACGDGGSGGGLDSDAITAEEAEPLCRAGCEHDVTCGSSTDVETCTTSCVEEVEGWVRGDAFETLAECATALACDAPDDDCLLQIQPLDIHLEWEETCRAQLAACVADPTELDSACEVSPDPTSDDIGFFRFIAPEIMEEMIACLVGTDCAAQIGCVEAILDREGIDF